MEEKKKLKLKDQLTIYIKRKQLLSLKKTIIFSLILSFILISINIFSVSSAKKAPAALTTSKVQLRLTFTGDIEVSDCIRKKANQSSYAKLLTGISKYIKKSDYVITNLSGPVLKNDVSNYKSTRNKDEESYYLRPAALRGFLSAGINMPSFANDDAYNYGTTGINTTISMLNEYESNYLGVISDSSQPIYKVIDYEFKSENGDLEKRNVAIISVNDEVRKKSTPGENKAGIVSSSMEILYETIYDASQENDYVIAYVHFSKQNSEENSNESEELAHMLIDAGADVVIGNSDTLNSVEKYEDGIIAYSLGALITDEVFSYNKDGAMLDFVVRNSGEVIIYMTPIRIQEGTPIVVKEGFYAKRIQKIITSKLEDSDYKITKDGIVRISLGQLPINQKEDTDMNEPLN